MTNAQKQMVTEMQAYFAKIKSLVAGGSDAARFKYLTGSIPANGTITIVPATQLGYVAANYNSNSVGIQLSMVDPTAPTTVIPALTVLTYKILANGDIQIVSNYSGAVTYHLRLTMPVLK